MSLAIQALERLAIFSEATAKAPLLIQQQQLPWWVRSPFHRSSCQPQGWDCPHGL